MINTYLIRKISLALVECFKTFRKTPPSQLTAILLVKNEESILEEDLLFHKAMGVDSFIIIDNNSTDSTPEIIRKYRQKEWIKEIIEEKATDYEQKEWVDRMIWKAKTIYRADQIINIDADELWYSPSGNFKADLSATHANVLNCETRSVYLEEDQPFWQQDRVVKPVSEPERYNLSTYSIFGRQNKKVIHRSAGYLQISMGNHKVTMLPQLSTDSGIRVYYYNIRRKQQFLERIINRGRRLEQHRDRHGGRHWRYFYKLYKEGKLEVEYDRVIGKKNHDIFYDSGFIYKSTTIQNTYKQISKE